jgi:predicted ester cyclase
MSAGSIADVVAFANALVEGDDAAIRSFLAEDYYGHSRAPDEPSQVDRWLGLLPDVRAAVPDLRIEVEERAIEPAAPGEVGVRAVASGTHAGELWGSPGTGKPIRIELALRFRPTDGGWLVQGDDPPPAAIAALRVVGVIPPADAMHLEPKDPVAPPEFLLKLGFAGQAADKPCTHLGEARVFEPSTAVCAECVAIDSYWPALRMCIVCGAVGCCDTSLNKHLRAHSDATGHALMRSIRLEEGWIWCYVDAAFFERATLERLAAAAGAPIAEG